MKSKECDECVYCKIVNFNKVCKNYYTEVGIIYEDKAMDCAKYISRSNLINSEECICE